MSWTCESHVGEALAVAALAAGVSLPEPGKNQYHDQESRENTHAL